jgi:hypothetical protein
VALREGRGWLYRVRGRSPARGRELAVYVLAPEPLSPGSAGRAAAMLSGDPRFEPEEAWAERLPFPARGFAAVDTEAGRVIPAVPEEVWRRLEECRAR